MGLEIAPGFAERWLYIMHTSPSDNRVVRMRLTAGFNELGFRTLWRAEAHIQHSNVPEAAQAIGEAAILAALHTSQRIDQRITALRTALTPAQRTKAVRELDDILAVARVKILRRGSQGFV